MDRQAEAVTTVVGDPVQPMERLDQALDLSLCGTTGPLLATKNTACPGSNRSPISTQPSVLL
jgi:hypothetical protein